MGRLKTRGNARSSNAVSQREIDNVLVFTKVNAEANSAITGYLNTIGKRIDQIERGELDQIKRILGSALSAARQQVESR